MAKYRVTPRAEEDLKSIGRHTQQYWGRAQRNVYLKNLKNRFFWLVENPTHGRHAGIRLKYSF
jgi:toxin ParE1/3/4